MELDWPWFLIGVPVAFALGWVASRLDLRQWRRDARDNPRAYYKGLNLLLNEQQDKAIDAFIEAVQHDPDTAELHFALGNLFRRRGEFERAVRVHQHLLQRADLPASERDRAQHALAQDYAKAGLFDRAEAAYRSLAGTAYDEEAQLALLGLYERSREWRHAIETAGALEAKGHASFGRRVAHFWCELANEAMARQDDAAADEALAHARKAAPDAARPWVMTAQRALQAGEPNQALKAWAHLSEVNEPSLALVANDMAQAARAVGDVAPTRTLLQRAHARNPSLALVTAMATLDGVDVRTSPALREHLHKQHSMAAAQLALEGLTATPTEGDSPLPDVARAVARAALPLQRYRCAACGFEAQHYFWQCPGCLGWDTFPPQRIEEL